MTADKRTGWLAKLKTGDRVAVRTSGASMRSGHCLGHVSKVTPAGYMDVLFGLNPFAVRFPAHGRHAPRDSYTFRTLVETTPAIVEEVRQARLAAKLAAVKWQDYTAAELQAVWTAVQTWKVKP